MNSGDMDRPRKEAEIISVGVIELCVRAPCCDDLEEILEKGVCSLLREILVHQGK